MSEWREYKLKEITTKIGSGATPTGGSNAYKTAGISLIRSQNVLDFKFSNDGLAFIDNQQADELKNVIIKKNDVLLNITGDSVARVCKVPEEILPARVNQHVAIIRADDAKTNSNYLLYYLQSIKEFLLIYSEIGGTRNALTKAMIENIDIPLPSLPEQTALAEVLSCLDDKIDLLHRQNKTLDQLAETLFRQWFVEEAGESFGEGKLEYIAIFNNGKSRPDEVENGSVPVYGGNGILGYTNLSNYEGISIIVGRVGAYCGSLFIENKPIWLSDNALLARSKEGKEFFLFYLLRRLELNTMAEGSSHPLLTQTLLKSIDITIPAKHLVNEFDNQAREFWDKIYSNTTQIKTLTQLRDTLLPKLMSGEVRVEN